MYTTFRMYIPETYISSNQDWAPVSYHGKLHKTMSNGEWKFPTVRELGGSTITLPHSLNILYIWKARLKIYYSICVVLWDNHDKIVSDEEGGSSKGCSMARKPSLPADIWKGDLEMHASCLLAWGRLRIYFNAPENPSITCFAHGPQTSWTLIITFCSWWR